MAKEVLEIKYFEKFVEKFDKIEPSTIANILINVPKEIKTRFNLDSSKLSEKDYEEILNNLNGGKITKEAVIDLLIKKIKNEKINFADFESISDEKLETEIKKVISEKPNLSIAAYMGLIMAKYRGKVEGKKVMDILKRILG